MGRRGGGFGTTLVLAFVIVVLSVASGVRINRFGFMERIPIVGLFLFEEQPTQTTTGPGVVEGIQDLNQLVTVRWTESVPITKESGGTELERFFFGERVLLISVGEVEAGVNLADIGGEDVQVNGISVTLRLPEPEILSTRLNEEETRVYDRDFSLLNLRSDDDLVDEAREQALIEVEETTRKTGILDYAESNAEDSIRAFVTSLGFGEVEFVDCDGWAQEPFSSFSARRAPSTMFVSFSSETSQVRVRRPQSGLTSTRSGPRTRAA
jgi:hypothetical protein